jgi:VanZ family protein
MNWKPYLPAVLWLGAVTYLSLTSNLQLPKIQLFSPDKLGHAAAYAVLSWLLLWGYWKSRKRPILGFDKFKVFSFATAYGAFMEWVQGTYFPNRFFEYDDMLANAAGAFLAVLLAVPLYNLLFNKPKHQENP